MKENVLVACFIFFLSLNTFGQTAAESCKKDLDFLPSFLLENDSGAKDHLQYIGQEKLNIAFTESEEELKHISSAEECDVLLKNYLLKWRKDHINIRSTRPNLVKSQLKKMLPPKL